MREIEELIGNQTAIPYTIPIRFRVGIPLDDLLIFSAFTDYPNGLFDLITGLHAEPLTESGLQNLVCDIKPVTMSINNYVITEVTANMAGYKATDACINRIRQFYSQRPFIVPARRVEVWPFPTSATLTGIRTSQNVPLSHVSDFCLLFSKDARATTCIENPCYQNMQVTTCGRNFPDMPINTNGALTFDGLDTQNQNTSVELRGAPISQGATDSYYNVDTSGKRPPPPILCTAHDTFWLFSPAAGGSCIYDTNHSFDEVIGPLSACSN
ncbi:MAG: hypothetical protein EZS28_037607 [Streblomastix strix]|uniref:Uncharacterized protein n=1 Tax=Streblomastix strix TaxID=222440 RepID=A0A5J4U7L0_9EUKA|nr:MAG: hypothetical protein EZS28_037607 [Streblomastix strix]